MSTPCQSIPRRKDVFVSIARQFSLSGMLLTLDMYHAVFTPLEGETRYKARQLGLARPV